MALTLSPYPPPPPPSDPFYPCLQLHLRHSRAVWLRDGHRTWVEHLDHRPVHHRRGHHHQSATDLVSAQCTARARSGGVPAALARRVLPRDGAPFPHPPPACPCSDQGPVPAGWACAGGRRRLRADDIDLGPHLYGVKRPGSGLTGCDLAHIAKHLGAPGASGCAPRRAALHTRHPGTHPSHPGSGSAACLAAPEQARPPSPTWRPCSRPPAARTRSWGPSTWRAWRRWPRATWASAASRRPCAPR